MGKTGNKGIITKNTISFSPDWLIWGILVVALFLRVFRLDALTEFLGDQGRTMLILFNWVHHGIIPIVGPTTLTGQHLGPFFYYLLLPGYLVSGGPVGVSIWVALLGVLTTYMVYKTVKELYGTVPGLLGAALYGISPALVIQDRIIWEPNLIPLFGILFAWFTIRQHTRVSFRAAIAQGAVTGVLIQLHYPNIFFLALLGIVLLGHSLRRKQWAYIPLSMTGWFIGFLLVMLPFFVYEFGHKFVDIKGILQVFINTGSSMGKRETLVHASDYIVRVFGKILPGMTGPIAVALFAGWCVFLIGHFTSWNMFWTIWFVFGILAISRYSGVVYDHYLNFVIPVTLLMVGSVLSAVRSKIIRLIVFILFCYIFTFQIIHTDIFSPGSNDILRVSSAVRQTVSAAQNSRFSFTLVSSRSYSDLHYRYYFRIFGKESASVTDSSYPLLFIICDNEKCQQAGGLLARKMIPVLCYDPHCNEFYPTIQLDRDWVYVQEIPVVIQSSQVAKLYEFRRR